MTGTHNCLSINNVKFKGMSNSLQILNPQNVLLRGFSITSVNGRIIKNPDQVNKDDIIDTQLYEGTLKSRVIKKNGKMG